MAFRERVAESIGITLKEMDGFVANGKEWPEKDAIEPFLYHSDCDGILTCNECSTIGPRLAEIILSWTPKQPEDYDIIFGKLLVAAMHECTEEDADLVFC